MFTNNKIKDIHESRYIASWLNAGGRLDYGEGEGSFYKWLLSLGLTGNEAAHIRHLALNGKLELENNAREYLDKQHEYRRGGL